MPGLETSRDADGIAEFFDHMYVDDPYLIFTTQKPTARHCDYDAEFASSGERLPFLRWQHDRFGATTSHLSFGVPRDGITFTINFHTPVERGLTAEDRRLLRLLFDHMEHAQLLASRPPDLSSESRALMIINGQGRIFATSPAAEWLLSMDDGLSIRNRQLTAARPHDSLRIDAAIRSALDAHAKGTAGGALSLARPSGKRDWLLTVSPLPQPVSPFRLLGPSAIAQIVDPEATVALNPDAVWQSLFKLTPAEARLAGSLAGSDDDLRMIADRLGISYETARVHLKRIFEKTGTRSQLQLLRLLLRTGTGPHHVA